MEGGAGELFFSTAFPHWISVTPWPCLHLPASAARSAGGRQQQLPLPGCQHTCTSICSLWFCLAAAWPEHKAHPGKASDAEGLTPGSWQKAPECPVTSAG